VSQQNCASDGCPSYQISKSDESLMGVYRRGRVWWFSYQGSHGAQVRESSRSSSKRAAEKLLAKRKTEVFEGRWNLQKSNTPRLREWADRVVSQVPHPKTRERYSASASILVSFLGDVKLCDITSADIENFQQRRLSGQRHPATVNRDVAFLFRLLKLARRHRFIQRNPCEDVDRLKERQLRRQAKPLTYEEESLLLSVSEPMLRMLIVLLVETGLRAKKEALPLRWTDVNLASEPASIFVRDSKTFAGQRCVWLTEYCRTELLRWQVFVGQGYSKFVFPAMRTPNEHWSCYQDAWNRATAKVGLIDRRVYDLRSTFATRVNAAAHVTDLTLAHLLGHASTGILPTYAKAIDENTRSTMSRLNSLRLKSMQSLSVQ
jgi:integrase